MPKQPSKPPTKISKKLPPDGKLSFQHFKDFLLEKTHSYHMGRLWTPSLHRRLMSTVLKLESPKATSYYAWFLANKLTQPYRHYNRHDPRSKEIAELAQVAERWMKGAAKADQAFLKYILLRGAYAALDVADEARAGVWYRMGHAIQGTASILGNPKWGLRDIEAERDEDHPVKQELEEILSGESKKKRKAFEKRLKQAQADGEPLTDITDRELVWATGHRVRERLLTDTADGPVWFLDTEDGKLQFFDGLHPRRPDFQFDHDSKDDIAYTKTATRCDERLSLWKGKARYNILQRYGKAVCWYTGRIESQGITHDTFWLKAKTELKAHDLMRQVEKGLPKGFKRTHDWWDAKNGVFLRSYSPRQDEKSYAFSKGRGVFKKMWVEGFTGLELADTHASEAEAIEKFEAWELERLQHGSIVKDIHPVGKWEDGKELK